MYGGFVEASLTLDGPQRNPQEASPPPPNKKKIAHEIAEKLRDRTGLGRSTAVRERTGLRNGVRTQGRAWSR